MGADCSERVCYFGRAFVDSPLGDLNTDGFVSTTTYNHRSANQPVAEMYPQYAGWGSRTYNLEKLSATGPVVANTAGSARGEAHFYKECSNKGICNRGTGLCECFPGYAGEGCSRTACANDCSGHGTCQRLAETSPQYRGWDMYSTQECVCDSGYFGSDCSLRKCPRGDDPVTKYVGYTKISFKNRSDHENNWFDSTCLSTGFCAGYKDDTGVYFAPEEYHPEYKTSAACTAANHTWRDMTDNNFGGAAGEKEALRMVRARARMTDYFSYHGDNASTQADVRVWNHGGPIDNLPNSMPTFKGCMTCMKCDLSGVTVTGGTDALTAAECAVATGATDKWVLAANAALDTREKCDALPNHKWTPYHQSDASTLHSFKISGNGAHTEANCEAVHGADTNQPAVWDDVKGLEVEQYFRCSDTIANFLGGTDLTTATITGIEKPYTCENNTTNKWQLVLNEIDEGMREVQFQGFSWNPWYTRGGGAPPPSDDDDIVVFNGASTGAANSVIAPSQSVTDFGTATLGYTSQDTSLGYNNIQKTGQVVEGDFYPANPFVDICKNGSSSGMGAESCMNTAIEFTNNPFASPTPASQGFSLHRLNALSNYKMVATGKSSHATGVLSGGGCSGPDDDGTQCNDLDFWSMYLKDVSGEFQVGDTINVKGYGLTYRCSDSIVPNSTDRKEMAELCGSAFSAGVGSGGEGAGIFTSQKIMNKSREDQAANTDTTQVRPFTLFDAQYPSSTVSFNYDLCNYISDISTYYASGTGSTKMQRDEVQVLTIKFQKISEEECKVDTADGASRKIQSDNTACGNNYVAAAETPMGGHFAIEFEDEMGDTWMTKSIPITSHSSRRIGTNAAQVESSTTHFDIYPMNTQVQSAGGGFPTFDATTTIASLIEEALEELPNGVVGDVQVSFINDTFDRTACCTTKDSDGDGGECKEGATDFYADPKLAANGQGCGENDALGSALPAHTVTLKGLGRMDTERSYAITFLGNSGNLPKLKVAYSLTDKVAGTIASTDDASAPFTKAGNYGAPGATYTAYSNASCEGGDASDCLAAVSGTSDFPAVVTGATDADNKSKVFIQDTSFRAFPSYHADVAQGNDGSKENVECSNRGICDYTTGLCQCFAGFTNGDCSKQNALSIGA